MNLKAGDLFKHQNGSIMKIDELVETDTPNDRAQRFYAGGSPNYIIAKVSFSNGRKDTMPVWRIEGMYHNGQIKPVNGLEAASIMAKEKEHEVK